MPLFHNLFVSLFAKVKYKKYIMEKTKNEERIIDVFVNLCIDNIIKHEMIEGVTDLKSFADFVHSLSLDDYRLVEGIEHGVNDTFLELSDEERSELEEFTRRSLYDMEYPMMHVTIRSYEIWKWKAHLQTIVCDRILQLLKK